MPPKEEQFLELVHCFETENQYSGHGWNFEKTKKYIYHDVQMELEAGYFEHYLDTMFVKSVIELPVSYGCPSKCRFCASSSIHNFCPLHAEQMMALFEELYNIHYHICANKTTVVSLTGIGDIFFNPDNTLEFLQRLTSYENLQVTLSSCLWNRTLLNRISQLETKLAIRNIQFTCISDNSDILSRVMPIYASEAPDFKDIRDFVKNSNRQYFRINYVLIKGLNDSKTEFYHLAEALAEIKDKVIIRISKLNETKATKKNGLFPATPASAEEFSELLSSVGIRDYIFYSMKNDNMNCGQLITEKD